MFRLFARSNTRDRINRIENAIRVIFKELNEGLKDINKDLATLNDRLNEIEKRVGEIERRLKDVEEEMRSVEVVSVPAPSSLDIVEKYVSGRTMQDIARELGLSTSTVYVRFRRACREILECCRMCLMHE